MDGHPVQQWSNLPGSVDHAEGGQVAVAEAEERHEDDIVGVVVENGRQVLMVDVAVHEQRHKDYT